MTDIFLTIEKEIRWQYNIHTLYLPATHMEASKAEATEHVMASFGIAETFDEIITCKKRRLAFLISVGQARHKNDFLVATADFY